MKQLTYLKKLSPPEIIYFLYGESSDISFNLKVILLDLYLNDLLVVPKGFAIRPQKGLNFEYFTFITTGRNYKTHVQNSYEKLFLNNYKYDSDLRMTIMALIRRVYESIGFFNPYNKAIIKSGNVKEYFHPTRWYSFYFNRLMNDKGLKLKSEIKYEIESTKKQLLKNQDPIFIKNLIDQIGTNILLFNEIKFNKLKEVFQLENINLEVFKNVKYDFLIVFNNYKYLHQYFDYFYDQVIAEIEREKSSSSYGFESDFF